VIVGVVHLKFNRMRASLIFSGRAMHRLLIIVGLSLLCSGCLTTQEQANAIAASDDAACQTYGAQPGSQAYFQCRMAKDQQRQANRTALAAAILSQPQPQPYYLPMPQH
jgi:hypothetical protein